MEIITTNSPNADILRQSCKPVADIRQHMPLIIEMYDLLAHCGGLGLAAPQVGIAERFFVARIGGSIRLFINPSIGRRGRDLVIYREGCLSLPGRGVRVERARVITACYEDENGVAKQERLSQKDAVVFQHEADHLDGILMTDIGIRTTAQSA